MTTPVNSNHNLALAAAAQGVGYEAKQPERSIEYFQRAIQLEPDHREWKSSLAFAYHKAHREAEAISIWQELAKGKDDYASQATRSLTKTGAKP